MASTDTNIFALNRGRGTGGYALSFRERPSVNFAVVASKIKPANIALGVYYGFEMPVSNWADDQYLFLTHSVPRRWDGVSNPIYSVACILGTANTDVKFQMRVGWRHYTPDGDVLPDTSTNVDVETVVSGAKLQYFSYKVNFTIDYDILTPDNMAAGDVLALKIGRIAKTAGGTEATGNIIIFGGVIQYNRDKVGSSQ